MIPAVPHRWRAMAALSAVLAAALAATSCGPAQSPPDPAEARQDEAAYLPPPRVDRVEPGAGAVTLGGLAAPGARVQLARPGGGSLTTTADASGRWRIAAPVQGQAQVFGLSQTLQGRTVQAEGYVFISPDRGGWLLRAGAAARPLAGAPTGGLVIDYDRSGGTVVSGQGPADALLVAQVNGRRAGTGRTDAAGHFEIRLDGPVPTGESRLRIFGEGVNRETQLRLSPPAPPEAGPVRAVAQGPGLRIDWLTPGGGVQTTQILP